MNPLVISPAYRARAVSFVAAACLALTIPLSPANAGFFDFLFPPQPAPMAAPMYPGPHYYARPHQKKKVASRHPKIVAGNSHPALAHVVSSVMEDDSLKDGDAVMTDDGIRIFTGTSGSRHTSEDFAKIADIKGLSKRQRSALIEIAAGSAGADPQPALLNGRSAADSSVAEGEMIVDPKGNKIRYVGP